MSSDRLYVFWLFGRPYRWHVDHAGQHTLMPATWLHPREGTRP